jgi:heme-degrading monooxygenase HmoA
MVYEVRSQRVDPARRAEYIKAYKQAIQPSKEAGCRGGLILCDDEDSSHVMVLLEWETKEHHLRWRDTPAHAAFRNAIAPWQTDSHGSHYVAEEI